MWNFKTEFKIQIALVWCRGEISANLNLYRLCDIAVKIGYDTAKESMCVVNYHFELVEYNFVFEELFSIFTNVSINLKGVNEL